MDERTDEPVAGGGVGLAGEAGDDPAVVEPALDPILDRLVGSWDVAAEWEKVPGGGLHRFAMTVRNEWVYGGVALESRYTGPGGTEDSRVTYAYDQTAGNYVGFAVSRLSTSFTLERGAYDVDGPALVLDSAPAGAAGPHPFRYRRTIWFLGDDEYAMRISNPDDSSARFIGMYLTHTRSS